MKSALSALAALAVLSSCSTTTPPASDPLIGTSWQLVKFQGGDGRAEMPLDRSQYSLSFRENNNLVARIDCNRGTGSWKSAGPGRIEFGPMAITRAMCPNPLLHDKVVTQLGNIRSYVIKNGHLFLSLMADGGTFEFEPAR